MYSPNCTIETFRATRETRETRETKETSEKSEKRETRETREKREKREKGATREKIGGRWREISVLNCEKYRSVWRTVDTIV